ncbi:MAG: hypothetical protein RDU59_08420 [Thermodesulfobacteriota bacterium]|nr:hypothetical protein [Thermodesulfobacteriota bacterium]
MPFERFTEIRKRIDTPKAAIWSRGQIAFNQSAVEEYNINNYKYVVLFYDIDTTRVGFVFTNDEKSKGAMKLVIRKAAGASFSARAFLKNYKIDFKETQRYDLTYDEQSKLHVIDLKQKGRSD